jgi:asparagine synthase (glutamine-hydrolysing)
MAADRRDGGYRDRRTLILQSPAGARAVFTGNSGDAVFCYLESASPLVDRILCEGLGLATWRTLADIHRLTGAAMPAILGQAARKWMARRRPYRWRVDARFLSRAHAGEATRLPNHPWFPEGTTISPGKTGHLARLAQYHYHQEAFTADDACMMVSPLLSQPLVEFCLQVPSWMWCEGGINRSLAREAFASDLPEAVIGRRSKGGTDGLLVEIFERARPALVPWLCDGHLAGRGVIDRDGVRNALSATGPTLGDDYLRLLDLADAESWARAQ